MILVGMMPACPGPSWACSWAGSIGILEGPCITPSRQNRQGPLFQRSSFKPGAQLFGLQQFKIQTGHPSKVGHLREK